MDYNKVTKSRAHFTCVNLYIVFSFKVQLKQLYFTIRSYTFESQSVRKWEQLNVIRERGIELLVRLHGFNSKLLGFYKDKV